MYTPSGFFALRAPLLAFDTLLAWADAARASPAAARAELARILADPILAEALWLASPGLVARREAFDEAHRAALEPALVRYLARLAGRATPFGLFAGTSVGTLGPRTCLELAPRAEHRRHVRLDVAAIARIAAAARAERGLRAELHLRPNATLYERAGELRYASTHEREGGTEHRLEAVEKTPYLVATLERAEGGARAADLAAPLVAEGASAEDAEAYVDALVDAQLLVPDLDPAVTGDDPLAPALAALAACPSGAALAGRLQRTQRALRALSRAPLGLARGAYEEALAPLEGALGVTEAPRALHVELVRPGDALALGPRVVAELARAIELAARLSPPHDADDPLARFRRAFHDRYGDREVDLVEALDDDSGVGFDPRAPTSAATEGLPLRPRREPPRARWGKREARLLAIVARAERTGAVEAALDDDDLAALVHAAPLPLPDALAVTATVLAPSSEAVDRGDFRLVVDGVGGPPGARLLARFCHADPKLAACVEAHLRAEEALEPEAIFAEIVHRPEARVGNVVVRPSLRAYEIPVLGRGSAPPERTIPLSDLRVRVVGDRVLLRSRAHARAVVPRNTTAHNHTAFGVSIYRFLCAVASQGVAATTGFAWGALDAAPFLPRIVVGRLVLSLARWRLDANELRRLDDPALRTARRLPRLVALEDGDQLLPVVLDSPPSVAAALELVRSRDEARFVELLAGERELCVRGEGGRYVHEIVVPFVKRSAAPASRVAPPSATSVPRTFPPGSEWLTAKLYVGRASADRLLVDVVAPLVAEARASGALRGWFFLRYADPEWHLRVRFRGEPARLLAELLPKLRDAVTAGHAHALVLDTYEREVERYGGPGAIEAVERIFEADSDAALALVALFPGHAGEGARWRLALRGVRDLADDLELGKGERLAAIEESRAMFFREMGGGGELEKALSRRFRAERAALEALLDRAAPNAPHTPEDAALAVFRERSARVRAIAEHLVLDAPRGDVAASLFHMHANRLLRAAAREQELVIYDGLSRISRSRAARGLEG